MAGARCRGSVRGVGDIGAGEHGAGRLGGRVGAVQDWLGHRVDSSPGRLGLRWFHGYFEASRNSGSAATLYSFLSVFPTALAAVAYFHAAGGDADAFSNRLVAHMKLTGASASLVRNTFGTASSNALAATLVVVISFLIWGLGIGQIYRDVYARAWEVEVGSAADQGLFAIWYFVVVAGVGLTAVSAEQLRATGWYVLVPVWLVCSTVFWLWTPWFLLHRRIGLRALLPGALLASICVGGAVATSPLWVGSWVNSYGKYFGSFGVTVALLAYVFVVATLSMVCMVFSPSGATGAETSARDTALPWLPRRRASIR